MPNYCHNTLILKCEDVRVLQHFFNKNRITEEDVQINGGRVMNLSVSRASVEVLLFYERIYDFYWGTKWDAIDVVYNLNENEKTLVYSFDTAWNPPYYWLQHVAKRYKQVEFTLQFCEECIEGETTIVFKNGVEVSCDINRA
jgi:hypothetical protein